MTLPKELITEPKVKNKKKIKPKPEPVKEWEAAELEEDQVIRTEYGSWIGLQGDLVIYLNGRIQTVVTPTLFAEFYQGE